MAEPKEKAQEVKSEVKAEKALTCKVSMYIDGHSLVAGQPAPKLSKAAQEHIVKTFGSLDAIVG